MIAEPDVYRALQQRLDRMAVGFPPTESGVELRILAQLLSPAEAELALELSAIPEPLATIHGRVRGRMTFPALRLFRDRYGPVGHGCCGRAGDARAES